MDLFHFKAGYFLAVATDPPEIFSKEAAALKFKKVSFIPQFFNRVNKTIGLANQSDPFQCFKGGEFISDFLRFTG